MRRTVPFRMKNRLSRIACQVWWKSDVVERVCSSIVEKYSGSGNCYWRRKLKRLVEVVFFFGRVFAAFSSEKCKHLPPSFFSGNRWLCLKVIVRHQRMFVHCWMIVLFRYNWESFDPLDELVFVYICMYPHANAFASGIFELRNNKFYR